MFVSIDAMIGTSRQSLTWQNRNGTKASSSFCAFEVDFVGVGESTQASLQSWTVFIDPLTQLQCHGRFRFFRKWSRDSRWPERTLSTNKFTIEGGQLFLAESHMVVHSALRPHPPIPADQGQGAERFGAFSERGAIWCRNAQRQDHVDELRW